MKILALSILSALLLACSDKTIENDSKWAVEYMAQFKSEIDLEGVRKVLLMKKDNEDIFIIEPEDSLKNEENE